MGTPTEEDWPGVSRLPGYKTHRLGQYKRKKLGLSWPRVHDAAHGEALATSLLQLNPLRRLGAEEAMVHPYFNELPRKLLELPDGKSFAIFNQKKYQLKEFSFCRCFNI